MKKFFLVFIFILISMGQAPPNHFAFGVFKAQGPVYNLTTFLPIQRIWTASALSRIPSGAVLSLYDIISGDFILVRLNDEGVILTTSQVYHLSPGWTSINQITILPNGLLVTFLRSSDGVFTTLAFRNTPPDTPFCTSLIDPDCTP